MDTQTIPPLDKPLIRDFEVKAANTIRMLAADGVQAANSGHPGMPMGMAVAALTLWARVMRYNPVNPQWLTATALCSAPDTVRCCSTRCCT
jgi:hypothetical protein